jgi:hypothetical protein
MRVGYGLGTSPENPSLGTAAALLVYDTSAHRFFVHDNPGLLVAPGYGQRPAAIKALATAGVTTIFVRPGALCPESYELARHYQMRFVVWQDLGAPDHAMIHAERLETVSELPESFYAIKSVTESEG